MYLGAKHKFMKKLLLMLIMLGFLFACNQSDHQIIIRLNKQTDSLRQKLEEMKPGLGEYMMSIQAHHGKLWFAGKNQNWQLAQFEIDEINECVEGATKVETDRPEVKMLTMIKSPLAGLEEAIAKKDTALFNGRFQILTASCNACHQSVKFSFINIKVPETPSITNQVWR